MKEKLTSRKLWVTILTSIVSVSVIFTDIGGTIGTIAGIIGIVASSVSYLLSEGSVDVARAELEKKKVDEIINLLKQKEGDS